MWFFTFGKLCVCALVGTMVCMCGSRERWVWVKVKKRHDHNTQLTRRSASLKFQVTMLTALATAITLAFAPPSRPTPAGATAAAPVTVVQQRLLALGAAALLSTSSLPALAEEAGMTIPQCRLECNTECNNLAPGNKEYCATQCDDFCDNLTPEQLAKGSGGSATGEGTTAVAAAQKDCGAYKTDAAKSWCANENKKASSLSMPSNNKDLGIFGDSGVSYSKGVEDLFATAFGATRQSQSVKDADIGGFAGDIGNAAAKAFFGK